VFIPLFFKALKQKYDKYSVTSLNKSKIFCWYRSVPCNSNTKNLYSRYCDKNVLFV